MVRWLMISPVSSTVIIVRFLKKIGYESGLLIVIVGWRIASVAVILTISSVSVISGKFICWISRKRNAPVTMLRIVATARRIISIFFHSPPVYNRKYLYLLDIFYINILFLQKGDNENRSIIMSSCFFFWNNTRYRDAWYIPSVRIPS
jgi:hypothetical protein